MELDNRLVNEQSGIMYFRSDKDSLAKLKISVKFSQIYTPKIWKG